jgi:hypothetical protein
MLIKTTDGGIVDIKTDEDCLCEGCPTCGYGSVYLSEITVYLTKYKIEAKVTNEYEYAMTVEDTLKLFLPHIDKIQLMREKEFVVWFMNWVAENAAGAEINFNITDANNLVEIKPEDLV